MAADPVSTVRDFVAAFATSDAEAMAAVLDEGVVAHITNAQGGADRIEGRDELLARIGAVDYGAAQLGSAGGGGELAGDRVGAGPGDRPGRRAHRGRSGRST